MYQSKAFRNFLNAQASQYGSHYKAYAEEFQGYDDEELLQQIENNASEMSNFTCINNNHFNDYFSELQRMIECVKLRQEFLQEMEEDDLL